MDTKPNFPYKTLIWAVFAVLALLLFRAEIKQLLGKTQELSLFGVEIKASEDKADKLKDSIQNFETTITALSNQLTNQQIKINDLSELKTQLETDLANCPEAKETSKQFNAWVAQIVNTNKDLTTKSNKLVNTQILKNSTYNVKLIVPSKMINAKIFVDGKEADILKRSGIVITVRVQKKNSSHSFEIRSNTKKCATDKLITKDAMEVPIACDS